MPNLPMGTEEQRNNVDNGPGSLVESAYEVLPNGSKKMLKADNILQ